MNAPFNIDPTLSAEVRVYEQLRERLAQDFGLDREDEAIRDTLDGMTNLKERLAFMVREIKEAEALADGITMLIKEYQERRGAFERRGERLRAHVLWALQEIGERKIVAPEGTFYISKGREGYDVDPASISRDLCKIEYKPDHTAIKAAIEAGRYPDGVTKRNNPPSLVVK